MLQETSRADFSLVLWPTLDMKTHFGSVGKFQRGMTEKSEKTETGVPENNVPENSVPEISVQMVEDFWKMAFA